MWESAEKKNRVSKCMKESSKYHFLYNSPGFTKGRSKGKHRKFHFDTCLSKLISFSQFIFVVTAQQRTQSQPLPACYSGHRPGVLLTFFMGLLNHRSFIISHQGSFSSWFCHVNPIKAQITKENLEGTQHCWGTLSSRSWAQPFSIFLTILFLSG